MNHWFNIVFSIATRRWVTDEIKGEVWLLLQLFAPKNRFVLQGQKNTSILHMTMQTIKK